MANFTIKDIHVLTKRKNNQNRYYLYVSLGKGKVLWVTKEKSLSPLEEKRAFVSSWDRTQEIIECIVRGEIK